MRIKSLARSLWSSLQTQLVAHGLEHVSCTVSDEGSQVTENREPLHTRITTDKPPSTTRSLSTTLHHEKGEFEQVTVTPHKPLPKKTS